MENLEITANVDETEQTEQTAPAMEAAASEDATLDKNDDVIARLNLSSKSDEEIRAELKKLRDEARPMEQLYVEAKAAMDVAYDAMLSTPEGVRFLAVKLIHDNRKAEYDARIPAIKAYSKVYRERMKAFRRDCVVKVPRRTKKSREERVAAIPVDQALIVGLQ